MLNFVINLSLTIDDLTANAPWIVTVSGSISDTETPKPFANSMKVVNTPFRLRFKVSGSIFTFAGIIFSLAEYIDIKIAMY